MFKRRSGHLVWSAMPPGFGTLDALRPLGSEQLRFFARAIRMRYRTRNAELHIHRGPRGTLVSNFETSGTFIGTVRVTYYAHECTFLVNQILLSICLIVSCDFVRKGSRVGLNVAVMCRLPLAATRY